MSSLLFIGLGVVFIAFQGSGSLGGLYQALGASDLSLSIETAVHDLADRAPLVLVALVALPITLILALAGRAIGRRHQPAPEVNL